MRRRAFLKSGLVFTGLIWIPRAKSMIHTGIRNPFWVSGLLKSPAAGGLGAFSDNFNRSNEDPISGGGVWTEIKDCQVISNAANSPQDFSNDMRGAAYTGTSCGSIIQYVKWTMTGANSGGNILNGCIFRWTNAASPFYSVRANDGSNLIEWYSHTSTSDTGTLIGSQALSFTIPATFGATIVGTGNSTVAKVWLNPSANAPTDSSTWDGGASSTTDTTDPASAVDTGNFVGIIGNGSLGALEWEDFFGGGLAS